MKSPDRRRLSRSVGSEESEDFALIDIEAQVVGWEEGSTMLDEVLDRDSRFFEQRSFSSPRAMMRFMRGHSGPEPWPRSRGRDRVPTLRLFGFLVKTLVELQEPVEGFSSLPQRDSPPVQDLLTLGSDSVDPLGRAVPLHIPSRFHQPLVFHAAQVPVDCCRIRRHGTETEGMHLLEEFVPVRLPFFQHEEHERLEQPRSSPLGEAVGSIVGMTLCRLVTVDDYNSYMFKTYNLERTLVNKKGLHEPG